MLLILVFSVPDAFSEDLSDNLKSPKHRIIKRPSNGTLLQGVDYPTASPVVRNAVSDGSTNLRCLLGGGRKLIRHDCDGEDPPSLEAVFTKDAAAGFGEMRLHDALSTNNGANWYIAGPLSDASMDTGRDRNHVIDFNDDLTYLCYTEMTGHPNTNFAYMYWTQDVFKCMQAFNPFVVMSNAPPPDSIDEYYTQLSMTTNSTGYVSFIDFTNGNPYGIYLRKSIDNGTTWGAYQDIAGTIGTDGFDAQGFDGPLILDADGDFVAAMTFVNLDPTWAASKGFVTSGQPVYPAYTQSTDGGATWADLRLIHGNDGTLYPRGHSGNTAFDDSVHYIGGTQDAAFTSFNNVQDNCVLTPDGMAHLTYTMRDTTFGYAGVWHALVDNGTITSAYVGFPENPGLEGASGVADMPGLAGSDDGHVIVGWTEYMQGTGAGAGDICYNSIYAGQTAASMAVPVNVTNDEDDETFQRIVDKMVPAGPQEYYVDWLFAYYGDGGSFADSTLWHLQTTLILFPPEVSIECSPDSVIVQAGDVLPLSLTITNDSDSLWTPSLQVSIIAELNNGSEHQVIRPVPSHGFMLPVGGSVIATFGVSVPPGIPVDFACMLRTPLILYETGATIDEDTCFVLVGEDGLVVLNGDEMSLEDWRTYQRWSEQMRGEDVFLLELEEAVIELPFDDRAFYFDAP